jgi:hypothetical protein
MRESRLGRWVARISVTLGLGVAVVGGVAVLSAGSAMAAPHVTSVRSAAATTISYASTNVVKTGMVFETTSDIVWW